MSNWPDFAVVVIANNVHDTNIGKYLHFLQCCPDGDLVCRPYNGI